MVNGNLTGIESPAKVSQETSVVSPTRMFAGLFIIARNTAREVMLSIDISPWNS